MAHPHHLDTHYAVLGVPATAPPADIRAAYLRLVKETHPDVGGSSDHFRRVQDAYTVLSDVAARATYDRGLRGVAHHAPRPHPPPSRAGASPYHEFSRQMLLWELRAAQLRAEAQRRQRAEVLRRLGFDSARRPRSLWEEMSELVARLRQVVWGGGPDHPYR